MSAARVKPGDLLGGKYRVERILGAGGMGVVVAARHIDLGQRVALKLMLKEALSDPASAERFAREARAAVRLQSPHTARVIDVGRLDNGEPYMVMEYLEGQDLDAVLVAHGPTPPALAVEYILQACEAIAEAHGLGMIHRDIKPKNLYLAHRVDGRPFVKVLDFGLAKTAGAGDVSLTATTAVFGSPQYMSPEQMRSSKDVDARSDVWSLGVCLYELITGRVPFDAPGVAEICATVLKDPVVPPSHWVPALAPELDAAIVRCLEKDPAARFQTVAELAFFLEPHAHSRGAAARILEVLHAAPRADYQTVLSIDAIGEPSTQQAWFGGISQSPARAKASLVAAAAVVLTSLLVLLLVVRAHRGDGKAKTPATSNVVEDDTVAPVEPIVPPPVATELPPAPIATGPTGLPSDVLGASPMSDASTPKPKPRPPIPTARPAPP